VCDLPWLVQGEVESIGAVGGVGAEDGVEIVRLGGAEAMRRVGLVDSVGLSILALDVFGSRDG
jgi:hypothetical protein